MFRKLNPGDVVSGGSGALGTALVAAVLESGGDVVCLDLPETPNSEAWSMYCYSPCTQLPRAHILPQQPPRRKLRVNSAHVYSTTGAT